MRASATKSSYFSIGYPSPRSLAEPTGSNLIQVNLDARNRKRFMFPRFGSSETPEKELQGCEVATASLQFRGARCSRVEQHSVL
jgi:hypothetical protein